MNILYAVPWLNLPGGIQEFAKSQYDALSKDHEITVADWTSPTTRWEELLYRTLPSRSSERLYSLRYRKGLEDPNVLLSSYDLVHLWHVDIAMAYPAIRSPVISCYGLEILEPSVRRYRSRHFLTALNGASRIVACSSFTSNYLIDHYGIDGSKIAVITPGIDLNRFSPGRYEMNSKIVIGTLSRLDTNKNIPNVIKALTILRRHYGVDFTYYLAGDGTERKRIMRELAKAGIEYRYFGRISESDKVSKFYSALDVFVLPPLESAEDVEGFGIVFLESSASGVPVVASNTGGVFDAVKPGISGLFADPRSPEDIARNIYAILESGSIYRFTSRQWAMNFSQDRTTARFQALYEDVLGQSSLDQ